MTKILTSDEWIDQRVEHLRSLDAPGPLIEMTDQVLRPYLRVLDAAQQTETEATHVIEALESIVATMVFNFMVRTVPQNDADGANAMFGDVVGSIVSQTDDACESYFGKGPMN